MLFPQHASIKYDPQSLTSDDPLNTGDINVLLTLSKTNLVASSFTEYSVVLFK